MAEIFWTENEVLQSIEFDASINENHEATATATEHPVEPGENRRNVTDHVIPGAETVSLEAHVTNTPIRQPSTQMRGVVGSVTPANLGEFSRRTYERGAQNSEAARYGSAGYTADANVLQFPGPFNRVTDIHELLLDLRARGVLVTVVTSLRIYEDCVITAVSVPRSVESGDAATFTINFQRLTFAESDTVEVPTPSQPRGNTNRNRGQQATEEVDEDSAEGGSTSLLAQGLDRVAGFFGR